MLGVRRLLGGSSSPDNADHLASSPYTPAVQADGPKPFPNGHAPAAQRGTNWASRSPSPTKKVPLPYPIPVMPQIGSPPASPGTTRAGLFRKEGRARSGTRQSTVDLDEDLSGPSDPSTRRSSSRSRDVQSPTEMSPDTPAMSLPRVRSPVSNVRPSPLAGPSMSSIGATQFSPTGPHTPQAVLRAASSSRTVGNPLSPDWKHSPSLLDTNDELLMSLLASQAVVDSRDFQILSSEEVDELKREQHILTTRLKALRQKLSTEIKIRNAAESLARLHATHKRMSRHTSDQYDAAVRKVDAAEKEVAKVADRAAEVGRRLGEHRAGVLSFSLSLLEKKVGINGGPGGADGLDDEDSSAAETATAFSEDRSRPSTAATSVSARPGTPRGKFAGPHLFAGLADATMPGMARPVTPAAAAALEERLKSANDTIDSLRKKEADLAAELEEASRSREDVENTLRMQLHAAEENVMGMEKELSRLEGVEEVLNGLERERGEWDRERKLLESRSGELEDELRRARLGKSRDREMEQKEEAWVRERAAWAEERAKWARERTTWEEERAGVERRGSEREREMAGVKKELADRTASLSRRADELSALQAGLRAHGVPHESPAALGSHLDTLKAQKEAHAYQRGEWEGERRRMQEELVEVRVKMGREVEEARREAEGVREEVRVVEEKLKSHCASDNARNSEDAAALADLRTEHHRVMTLLQEVWNLLPSAEARANKLGRSKTPTSASSGASTPSPTTPRSTHETGSSLSDLDVRALKILYDPKSGFASPLPVEDAFSVDSLVGRTKALIGDDRALMERLIRFAQAHDLLKANAERSQRLAQEGRVGMETYQKQVRQLEERIAGTVSREAALVAEITELHRAWEEARVAKRELESQAADQAETLQHLSEANKVLSSRTLALAAEAADAPQAARSKVEAQVGELKRALEEAQNEVESLRNAEQSQQFALLDELNSVQKENAGLRDQLRARAAGK